MRHSRCNGCKRDARNIKACPLSARARRHAGAARRRVVLWTLRFGDEVRGERDYFAGIEQTSPHSKLLMLVDDLIDDRMKSWNKRMGSDPVEDTPLDVIAAKRKHRKGPAKAKAEVSPQSGSVISIMDALRKSLSKEKDARMR